MSTHRTTTVHLQGDVADELAIDRTIEADAIDYYDSGFWVTHAGGRDFFPYHGVVAIREREETTETAEPAAEPASDPEHEETADAEEH